jgi:hypothetical protein
LVERTFEAARGAVPDRRALIAYLPLGCASLAYFVAKTTADHATSGSLDSFFGAAASLLGLLLVSVVIEARRTAARDPWLRALRGWWVGVRRDRSPPPRAEGRHRRRVRGPGRSRRVHYDGDYDILAEHTSLIFESVWLAPPGSL